MKTLLSIEGMTCARCAQHVSTALKSVPGVESADVDLSAKLATVSHSEDATVDALMAAVEEEGYKALPIV